MGLKIRLAHFSVTFIISLGGSLVHEQIRSTTTASHINYIVRPRNCVHSIFFCVVLCASRFRFVAAQFLSLISSVIKQKVIGLTFLQPFTSFSHFFPLSNSSSFSDLYLLCRRYFCCFCRFDSVFHLATVFVFLLFSVL